LIVLLFRSVACSIIAGSKKNARGKCNKSQSRLCGEHFFGSLRALSITS